MDITSKAAKRELETAEKAGKVFPHSEGKPKQKRKGGRPTKYGKSKKAIAADLGIGEATLERDEQHVELAERYPWLQSDAWRQADVLRLDRHFKRIPEEEQGELCQFMERAAAPFAPRPDRVIEYAEIMSLKTPDERSEIYRLSASADEREQNLARTRALHRPPMPDPRTAYIREALDWLRKAILPPYDQEPEANNFRAILTQLNQMLEATTFEGTSPAQREIRSSLTCTANGGTVSSDEFLWTVFDLNPGIHLKNLYASYVPGTQIVGDATASPEAQRSILGLLVREHLSVFMISPPGSSSVTRFALLASSIRRTNWMHISGAFPAMKSRSLTNAPASQAFNLAAPRQSPCTSKRACSR